MSRTILQNDQMMNAAQLTSLGLVAESLNKDIFSYIEKAFDQPLRMSASFPTADAKLNFRGNRTQKGDGTGLATPPAESSVPTYADSWINFQTGATSGSFDITFPTTTVGEYRRCGFTFVASTNKISASFSLASTSVSGLADPGTLFISGGIPLGWIDLEATAATAYKTIGSATSIIENSVGGVSRLNIFGSGGGGGGGGVNAYVAKTTTVTSGVSGTFTTGYPGQPVIEVLFWDDSAGKFLVLDPASVITSINSLGNQVDYDFTGITFSVNDYAKIIALYHDLVGTISNEYDSGWIDFANVNNLPIAGWHRVDLPSGFVAHPAGLTLLLDSGTQITPGDISARLVLSLSGSTYRVAVDVSDLIAGQKFRLVASTSARPSGNLRAMGYVTVTGTGTLTAPDGNLMVEAAITGIATTTLPSAAVTLGMMIFLKNPTAFNWTISSTDNIDGAGTMVLAASNNEAAILVSNGTTYKRFA